MGRPQIRRKAVVPALHRAYLSLMVESVFASCTEQLCSKLEAAAAAGTPVNMEAQFSQLTLDVIGQSVFNYEFDSLRTDSPVIQAVYTALKETESRSTDILPYWQVHHMPLHCTSLYTVLYGHYDVQHSTAILLYITVPSLY